MICSHCKRPSYRCQNCFARNIQIGKLPFLAHKHASCRLHRTFQHDYSAYIVQRRGSKHGTISVNKTANAASVKKTVNVISTPCQQRCGCLQPWYTIFIMIDSSSRQLIFHRSFIAFYNNLQDTSAFRSSQVIVF